VVQILVWIEICLWCLNWATHLDILAPNIWILGLYLNFVPKFKYLAPKCQDLSLNSNITDKINIIAAKKIGDSPIKSDMKLGPQTHVSAESQSKRTIQLVPKSWKMAIIIPQRRGVTWKGVPVATWWCECIFRRRGGLVHHTIMIPAALSFPLLRGAVVHLQKFQNDWFCTRISNFFQSPIFSIANIQLNFCYHQKSPALRKPSTPLIWPPPPPSSVFCLFISIKPENPYVDSHPGLEVKPLAIYPLGSRSSFCGSTKGTPLPRDTLRANWGEHSTSRRVGSHLWTYANPMQVASSATEQRPKITHVWRKWSSWTGPRNEHFNFWLTSFHRTKRCLCRGTKFHLFEFGGIYLIFGATCIKFGRCIFEF